MNAWTSPRTPVQRRFAASSRGAGVWNWSPTMARMLRQATRRLVPAALAAALLAAPAAAPAKHRDASRAVAAYRALQHNYYLPKRKLYRGRPYSKLWPFSQAMAAT